MADDIGSTDSGGQNVYVRELALALADRGHRVVVFTRRSSPREADRVRLAAGVEVVHVPAGPARKLPKEDLAPLMGDFGDQLALHWQEDPPDLVHAHYWMSGVAALAGARRTAIPVVTTFHALGLERIAYHPDRNEIHRERERERERVGSERTVGQISGAIIALTPEEVEYLTGPNGVSPSKITVVPVGVNLERFTPDGPAAGRSNRRARLVTVGRLVERKGVKVMIEALGELSERFDVELVVAGGPRPRELHADPTVRALRAHARKHGVETRVEFLGRIPHGQVPELLRSADVFVCAPHYEPFGTACLEAAACGVPVVAPAVGGLREHVIDGTTGFLTPPGDVAGFGSAVAELLGDPEKRVRMGAAGAANAIGYAWPAVTNRILATYDTLLKQG
ncbi:glycosyltransferase [Spirillospora sp. CA-294931]|uniref:glycosyltransferase n=1 Tax=Spirillospora sp. CA-294931 TaxID=3240042 RepID=UPI003D8CF9BB